MILYLITEENHGEIAITETFDKAIDFLFKDNWINEYQLTKTAAKDMTLEEFNDYFEDMIIIEKIEFEEGVARLR